MLNIYSTGVVTDSHGHEYTLEPDLVQIMATSRDYDRLQWAWQGWRDAIGRRIKPLYARLVDMMNQAAVDNGNLGNIYALTSNYPEPLRLNQMRGLRTTAIDDPGRLSASLSVTRLRCAKTLNGSRSCWAGDSPRNIVTYIGWAY